MSKKSLIGFIFVIFILALIFHYPVRIIDALTSELASGFGIKISVWRILFEPFVGPLLFYLRADQPLLEFVILLIWVLSLSLIVSIITLVLNKEVIDFKAVLHKFLAWLRKVPLIFCIWTGLLLVMIFVHLPANTIMNKLENTILINAHSHTEYSHDGIISRKDIQKWHEYHNFDAFFITDHNHHEKTLEAVKAQNEGTLPTSPLIIAGEEFSGSNHMTLLGLKSNFITRTLSDQQVIDSTHKEDGIVIVAHWFDDKKKSIPYFVDLGVDGFEIANQNTGLSYDRRIFNNIVKACSSNGLIMNGAADYHGYGSTCFVWNALDIPGWHEMDNIQRREAILNIMQRKDMSRLKVLLYNDRNIFDRNEVFLSPVFTVVNYFRTLNFYQVLSWFFWLVIIWYSRALFLKRKWFSRIRASKVMKTVAFTSALYILILGYILLNKAKSLTEYNDIYSEYGTILFLTGSGLIIYILILIVIGIRKKEILDKIEMSGFPTTFEGAKELAKQDRGEFKFEDWVIEAKLGGVCNASRTSIPYDGFFTFKIFKKSEKALVEVKSGHANKDQIIKFKEREPLKHKEYKRIIFIIVIKKYNAKKDKLFICSCNFWSCLGNAGPFWS